MSYTHLLGRDGLGFLPGGCALAEAARSTLAGSTRGMNRRTIPIVRPFEPAYMLTRAPGQGNCPPDEPIAHAHSGRAAARLFSDQRSSSTRDAYISICHAWLQNKFTASVPQSRWHGPLFDGKMVGVSDTTCMGWRDPVSPSNNLPCPAHLHTAQSRPITLLSTLLIAQTRTSILLGYK